MKKALASLALAGILTLSVGSVAAQAAPNDYPAGPPSGSVSVAVVAPGQAFIFSGSGFTPGEAIFVTITLSNPVAGGAIGSMGGGVSASVPIIIKPVATPSSFTTTASSTGTFSVPVELDKTGTYTLTATGKTSGVTVTQTVKVVAAAVNPSGNNVAGTQPGGLASTGVDASVLVWSLVGAGALAAGVGTVVVSRRRSRASADA
ncbi:LPXTG cell wall anchor domain-containing protein [Arthrobacter sp. STN4]|uniref:LPXTG cell wall anchor domain-containing protein n=1 Tax=Arthrobacter sp. STN4 TaxID=2923276 RepID=UPI002119BACB|nr:LPXTG cell wall anchor domain-containing protein [Arthrobacter sp. STN4]MCQ9163656.1 LPXTG cell wall anchor domain-containing protein [Arthrobacter sp. STN4]